MKNWIKYVISTVVFSITYTLVGYVLTKNIDWKLVIISTIIYAIIYTLFDLICNKSLKK